MPRCTPISAISTSGASRPLAALFVGGFARATRLRQADLTLDATAVAALSDAAKANIIGHCNQTMPTRWLVWEGEASGAAGAWRMVTADVDGCDLAQDERTIRVAWQAPVAESEAVRRELIRLLRS